MSGDAMLSSSPPAVERPARRPTFTLVCGALGGYDRERVLSMARALGEGVTVEHEDERSILALDRPALGWTAERQRGLAWSERVDPPNAAAFRSWHDAATAGAASGLVIEGRARYLHSSVSGVTSLYYLESDGAVYFASRIDPLLSAARGPLTADWEAWAAILTLDHPVGDRTPFVEIRRLPPFSTLSTRRGRARVSEERWPWAEIEPSRTLEAGGGELLDRLRATVARLPEGPIACELSGGWDSRLCLGLLVERRRSDLQTITVDHDGGTDRELLVAAQLADAFGIPHQSVAGREEDYWSDFGLARLRGDFQLVRRPWRIPKLEPLRRARATVVDGFGFDILAHAERFTSEEGLLAGGGDEAVKALWRRSKERQAKQGTSALDPALGRALWSMTRRQLMAESRRFGGHPSRAILTTWWTRTVRGISLVPHAILGADLAIATLFTDDAVARSVLAISAEHKLEGGLLLDLAERLGLGLERLPSTSFGPPPPRGNKLPRRSQSAAVAETTLACLSDGPLAPYVRPKVERVLTRHRRGRASVVPLAVVGPATFHLWHERYRDRLREVDPADVLAG